MFKEFKEFISRGNVLDLAIAVIIGGAFGKIITSVVEDLIMPIISLLQGGTDFSNLFISLDGSNYMTLAAAKEAGAATFNYGAFIQSLLDFIIIALILFFIVRSFNRFKKEEAPAPATTKTCPYCKTDIPIEATRCPHCTSQLEEANDAA